MRTKAAERKSAMWHFGLGVGIVALSVGCAHQQKELTRVDRARSVSEVLLSDTDSVPGSVYLTKIYIVQKGDTVGRIANVFRIKIKTLRELNPGLDPIRLWPGQRLRIEEELLKSQNNQ